MKFKTCFVSQIDADFAIIFSLATTAGSISIVPFLCGHSLITRELFYYKLQFFDNQFNSIKQITRIWQSKAF